MSLIIRSNYLLRVINSRVACHNSSHSGEFEYSECNLSASSVRFGLFHVLISCLSHETHQSHHTHDQHESKTQDTKSWNSNIWNDFWITKFVMFNLVCLFCRVWRPQKQRSAMNSAHALESWWICFVFDQRCRVVIFALLCDIIESAEKFIIVPKCEFESTSEIVLSAWMRLDNGMW